MEVSLQSVEDDEEREFLNSLGTALSLPGEAVDRLRHTGRQLLRVDPEFQRLLKDLSGKRIVDPDADESPPQELRYEH